MLVIFAKDEFSPEEILHLYDSQFIYDKYDE